MPEPICPNPIKPTFTDVSLLTVHYVSPLVETLTRIKQTVKVPSCALTGNVPMVYQADH